VRQITWIISVAIIAIISFVSASSAFAQSSRSQPSGATKKRARAAYALGQDLYKEGKYEEAEAAFNKAFDAVANPVVLLSIAETQKKLDRAPEAVATFQKYLELRPDASNREEVEQKISELKNLPAKVFVDSDPPGAEIIVDGTGTGKVTPAQLEVSAGEHTLGLSMVGKSPIRQFLTVQYGTRHELKLSLQAESPGALLPVTDSAPATEPQTPEDEKGDSHLNVAALVVTGVGVLAIGTGAILGVMALGDKSEFDKNPTKKTADRGERLALFADVAFGVGAAAVITGVVLWITQDTGKGEGPAETDESAISQAPRVQLVPALSSTYAGIETRLQF
jgi:tetratricopeptide (TPR) repeat protein